MIMDERLEFADAGDFATETGTSNVGDVIDLGTVTRDIGNGEPLYLVITVETAADGGGGATGTTQFQLVSDSVTSPATDGNQTIHLITQPFVAGDLTQGTVLAFPIPHGQGAHPYERYLGVQVVQAEEGEDDLVASAFLTINPPNWASYPDANN